MRRPVVVRLVVLPDFIARGHRCKHSHDCTFTACQYSISIPLQTKLQIFKIFGRFLKQFSEQPKCREAAAASGTTLSKTTTMPLSSVFKLNDTTRQIPKDYPRIYLFGDSLTEQAFCEQNCGFGWKLREYYADRVDVVNEGACFRIVMDSSMEIIFDDGLPEEVLSQTNTQGLTSNRLLGVGCTYCIQPQKNRRRLGDNSGYISLLIMFHEQRNYEKPA